MKTLEIRLKNLGTNENGDFVEEVHQVQVSSLENFHSIEIAYEIDGKSYCFPFVIKEKEKVA